MKKKLIFLSLTLMLALTGCSFSFNDISQTASQIINGNATENTNNNEAKNEIVEIKDIAITQNFYNNLAKVEKSNEQNDILSCLIYIKNTSQAELNLTEAIKLSSKYNDATTYTNFKILPKEDKLTLKPNEETTLLAYTEIAKEVSDNPASLNNTLSVNSTLYPISKGVENRKAYYANINQILSKYKDKINAKMPKSNFTTQDAKNFINANRGLSVSEIEKKAKEEQNKAKKIAEDYLNTKNASYESLINELNAVTAPEGIKEHHKMLVNFISLERDITFAAQGFTQGSNQHPNYIASQVIYTYSEYFDNIDYIREGKSRIISNATVAE